LGDGSTTNHLTPVQLKFPTGVAAVAGGGYHSLALTGDGDVFAWGSNDHGQLGDGTTTDRLTPVQVPNLGQIAVIAAGGSHSLAVTQDGHVFAWGLNNKGQLGDGSGTDQFSPVQLAKIDAVVAIEAGFNHSLAITNDHVVLAWGDNEYGQVGVGSTTADQPTPVQVAGLQEVDAIAGGFGHSLALTQDGSIFAWGSNNLGQLGDSSLDDRLTPVKVHWPSFEGAPGSIAAGGMHSLALAVNGTAWAWGSNEYGELAHFHHNPYAWIPVLVFDLGPAAALAGGFGHSLALMPDGSLWAWGANYSGQLGDGTTIDRSLPVRVTQVSGLSAISGGMHHSLAR
jgi:alpha-tubulin suppressor-like RCC1 family protein